MACRERRGGDQLSPPLLLVHGFLDTSRTWELVLPALRRERDVVTIDLGRCPQLDVPAAATNLILGFTG